MDQAGQIQVTCCLFQLKTLIKISFIPKLIYLQPFFIYLTLYLLRLTIKKNN